jgi:AraC-like DNA-binding protein
LQLLALLARPADASGNGASRITQRAKLLIMERCNEPLNMQALSEELNLGYSHFRQIFKAQTGTSPKHYHLAVRIERASDLIANTDKSLKEIAAILGFHSAFHFSNQFRQIVGTSPKAWRERFNAGMARTSINPLLRERASATGTSGRASV